MLHGRVWVGTTGAVVLGSVQPACLPAAPFLDGVLGPGLGCDPSGFSQSRLRGGKGPGRGGLPGRVCDFLWSMQTIAINQQCVVLVRVPFFPPLFPPVPAPVNQVPCPGWGGVGHRVRWAALSPFPGKSQRGVGEHQVQPGCSLPAPIVSGWWDGSLRWDMGMG